jgi:hypothetical protein
MPLITANPPCVGHWSRGGWINPRRLSTALAISGAYPSYKEIRFEVILPCKLLRLTFLEAKERAG